MIASYVTLTSGSDQIRAYVARPDGPGPYPGVVAIPHAGNWDEYFREFTRRWADHGFIGICPNIFERAGHGTPDDVAARLRGEGGVADDTVVSDAEAAMNWVKAQPFSNGKVGITGHCSGSRHAVLAASRVEGFGAVGNLWGGRVIMTPEQLNPRTPVAPIDLTPNLNAPMIGLFGNEDRGPSPEQVNQHEAVLQQYGKTYVFYRYDGAGHAFFTYDRPSYRQEQAIDGWNKLEEFFRQYLA
jgi:carboxymethylenebutenolidase